MNNKLFVDSKNVLDFNQSIRSNLLDLCCPFFQNFNLNHFGFTKFYEDGSRAILETNEDWINSYADASFYEDPKRLDSLLGHMKSVPQHGYYYNIFTETPSNPNHVKLFELDMWNSISFYKKEQGSIEIFHISAPRTHANIVDFYVNKNALLQHFIYFFKDKMLSQIESNLPIIPASCSAFLEKDEILIEDTKMKKFLLETSVNKFFIGNTQISRRQMECLYGLALGCTVKMIAHKLQLSPRSVEAYLNQLKLKLRLMYNADLVRIFHENFDIQVMGMYFKF
ncbi:MAG: helix-turn-helix transcriptional regulator [Alphaproteobacteria bacterium]|nr:helix-turn-helix transcriptional regulator [Alphaproteobacteria bacterium]